MGRPGTHIREKNSFISLHHGAIFTETFKCLAPSCKTNPLKPFATRTICRYFQNFENLSLNLQVLPSYNSFGYETFFTIPTVFGCMATTADGEPNLDRFYGNLRNYVRMVCDGYSNLLLLDAKGGLGKTHNVLETLREELNTRDQFVHQKGFTTPIELYKTLWKARESGTVLFLDDMSGVTSNSKAIDMLKAATDTQGVENWIEYRTSRDIEHPYREGATLPNTFCFRGSIIMSFNDTPDNRHFDALKDRGTSYKLQFSYQERLELITEIAKLNDFSNLSISEQLETADWIRSATDASVEVSIRTFEEVCQMREWATKSGENWQNMALDVFNLDDEKHFIIQMRDSSDLPIEQQIEAFEDEFGKSESHYYNLLGEIKDERDS